MNTDPALDAPTGRRGLRVAAVVTVVVLVWGSLWLLGRSAAPGAATHRATAPTQPAGVTGVSRQPPTFSQAEGWVVQTSGTVPPGSRDLPMALAVNVPMAEQDRASIAADGISESSATATLRSLPPDGVVIVAVLPFPAGIGPAPPHFGDFPDRGLPLELSDGRVNRRWQSQPRPDTPEYDVWGRVAGTYVEVSVYFGAPTPSSATYAAAQTELARLVLPGVPAGSAPKLAWTADDAGSLTIQTPPGWTFAANPVPDLVSPKIWFALGTWPFPRGGSCGPQAALRFLPRNGALLWLSETDLGSHTREFPQRPARFTLRGRRPVNRECSGSTYLIQFRDHGRAFQAQIAFGPAASARTRAHVLQSLSSLRVGSGAG